MLETNRNGNLKSLYRGGYPSQIYFDAHSISLTLLTPEDYDGSSLTGRAISSNRILVLMNAAASFLTVGAVMLLGLSWQKIAYTFGP